MKKIALVSFVVLSALLTATWIVCAERPVKIYSVDGDGTLKLKAEIDEGVQKIAVEPTDTELLIDDFEAGELRNRLAGEGGTWNETPYNDEISVLAEIAEGEGAGGSGNALRISYDVESASQSKVGYWTKLMGLNARQFDHVSFDVRGDAAAGFPSVFLIEIKKYKNAERIDKIKGTRVIKNVTSQWQTVTFPLNLLTGLFDQTNADVWKDPMLSRENLDEFVINLESRRVDKQVGALYIDNIRLLKTGEAGMHIMDQPTHDVMKTPVRLEGLDYMRFLIDRLRGFPTQLNPAREIPENDDEFLMMIARDTWRFFDEIVDRENHLPLDTIQLGKQSPVSEGGWVGDYTNVTNIGIYLMCLVSAYDLGFISSEETVSRLKATLSSIEKLEHHESGFLYNYYDTTTALRTSYFVSLVDSGWLDAGVYVAKNAFPEELTEQATRILNSHNFDFFYDEVEQQMTHGYFAHLNVNSDYLYGSFYTEPRATSYLAIGRGDVPEEHWFRLIRTFPEDYPWTTQAPIDRDEKTVLGYTFFGGHYQWKGIEFVPSWGGSMFEALMPTLILDEAKYAPEGLGLNNANYVDIHIRYTLEDLGYPVWGMSPSSVPEGGYSEYGVKPLGAKGYKPGVVTPHAAVLAIEYEPERTIQNLRKLIELYPIYGEYGFYDAVTVETGLVAKKYLALDQGMIFVALNNYLNDGAIRKRFHLDAINKKALGLLTEEQFFEKSEARTA